MGHNSNTPIEELFGKIIREFVFIAFAIVVAVVLFGYFKHINFANMRRAAHHGDIQSARAIATCYEVGCRQSGREVVFACAWRKIITDMNDAQKEDYDLLAQVCGVLDRSLDLEVAHVEERIRHSIKNGVQYK